MALNLGTCMLTHAVQLPTVIRVLGPILDVWLFLIPFMH